MEQKKPATLTLAQLKAFAKSIVGLITLEKYSGKSANKKGTKIKTVTLENSLKYFDTHEKEMEQVEEAFLNVKRNYSALKKSTPEEKKTRKSLASFNQTAKEVVACGKTKKKINIDKIKAALEKVVLARIALAESAIDAIDSVNENRLASLIKPVAKKERKSKK